MGGVVGVAVGSVVWCEKLTSASYEEETKARRYARRLFNADLILKTQIDNRTSQQQPHNLSMTLA